MQLIVFLKNSFLNFLFPKTDSLIDCENIQPNNISSKLQIATLKSPIPIKALFQYKEKEVQTLIKCLKYHNYKQAAELFGNYMAEYLLEELSEEELLGSFKNPILIPIPITKTKERERGYNQSKLITEQIIKQLQDSTSVTALYNFLERSGNAVSQTKTSSKKERLQNVAHQFIIRDKYNVFEKNILLIDDVITTGTTLKEASDVLKKAGAKEVRALVVAH